MDNETVRIVFYVDSIGGVEKVPETSTEPCSECGTEKTVVLTPAEIEALGYLAGRAIGGYAHGVWYRGLAKGLLYCPETVIELAVALHPGQVRSILLAHDIRERHEAD